jgi:hypothetical protein
VQVAPPRDQCRFLLLPLARPRHLDQAELHVLHVQPVRGLVVEAAQRLRGQLGLTRLAGDAEVLAAARDVDVQHGLDLLQVLVEHAAETGQPLIVHRGEGKLHGHQAGRRIGVGRGSRLNAGPRRRAGSAAAPR